jgi:cytidine deaminase, homotetrameric
MDNNELIKMAHKAKEFAYSPYSNFKVGAALLTTNGKVFLGCNIENGSYGATNCAERTAIFKAISEGYTNFEKIAIVSSSGDFTMPCGICLQVMSEFMLDKDIVLSNDNGDIKVLKVRDFLPHNFSFKKE